MANPSPPMNGVTHPAAEAMVRLPLQLRDEQGRVIYQRPRPIEEEVLRRLDSLVATKGHLPEERILAELLRVQNELARALGAVRAEMGAIAAQVEALGRRQERAIGQLGQQVAALQHLVGAPPADPPAPPPPAPPEPVPSRFAVVPKHTVMPAPTVTAETITGAAQPPPRARDHKLRASDVEEALSMFLRGDVETWTALGEALGVAGTTIRVRATALAGQTGRLGALRKVTHDRSIARGQVIGARPR